MQEVILDTNVLVAAAFARRSASARIVERVRAGQMRMIWNEPTRRETQYILDKIPRLSFRNVADLFHDENRYEGPTHPQNYLTISDADDRKFAALAAATGATLVTNDDDLLSQRDQTQLEILTPHEFWQRAQQEAANLDNE